MDICLDKFHFGLRTALDEIGKQNLRAGIKKINISYKLLIMKCL